MKKKPFNFLQKKIVRIKIRWKRFRYAVKCGLSEFHLQNTDIVKLTYESISKNKFSVDNSFIETWKLNTELKIQKEREKMAAEGFNIDDFKYNSTDYKRSINTYFKEDSSKVDFQE